MHFPDSWLTCIVSFFDALTLSPFSHKPADQFPIGEPVPLGPPLSPPKSPFISPPYPPTDFPTRDVAITCDYSAMADEGWEPCHSKENRKCWLRNRITKKEFNIGTDYENEAPKGVLRKYSLDVSEMALAPDGVAFLNAKVFNGTYPGPWIQMCWGDEVEITVRNHLWYNGTTIHWHGIRQLHSVEMDGVNGVTQCPIAPGDEFTYKFRALQYGSSWYHSHYSLQYPDGLAGPLTIYGPSSDHYDHAIEPLLMTDWNHRSAFEDWAWNQREGSPDDPIPMTNILLNGRGRYTSPDPRRPIGQPPRYTQIFQKRKRYLLRLINTSVDSTFIFTIDGHSIKVIGSDFVPIEPYTTNSVLVGIGQRYHVIVEASPHERAPDDNYWIRVIPAKGCGQWPRLPDDRVGIMRYDEASTIDPVSKVQDFPTECSDEPYHKLKPILKWKVGPPADIGAQGPYEVDLKNVSGFPYNPSREWLRWRAHIDPLWVDFKNPTINNLHPKNKTWPSYLDVVTTDTPLDTWIYLIIIGHEFKNQGPGVLSPPVAHPIHLHGHDFAILHQTTDKYNGTLEGVHLKLDNPPRRDVVLLPKHGFVVLAFRADNPGTWLLHCHIAWHASSGLAFQILENTDQIKIPGPTRDAMAHTCKKWNEWFDNKDNHWNNVSIAEFQDDSGV